MVLGVLTLELDIPEAQSLKDKRRVLHRIRDRVRHRFNVSIAEIEANEVWNYACMGVVIITNEQNFANRVLSKVVNLIDDIRNCELVDYTLEFLHQ